MDALFIPNENDFRKWVKEAVKECMDFSTNKAASNNENEEPLLSRKEIASFLGISLVTLTDWMKRGLPFHKLNGRVYFQRSEVLKYLKDDQRKFGRVSKV